MSQSDFVTRGQSLVTSGQFQEAVKVCRLGLLGRPTTVEGRIVLGQALLALKRYDEVLAEMRVALELDHSSLVAQTLKGEALLRKGDHNGALELLQQLRSQHPGDGRVGQLVEEARRASGRPTRTAGHPAVGFLGGAPSPPPVHGPDMNGDEDSGGSYTRPITQPPAKKRTSAHQPVAAPSAKVLAVGDRSGTVEVDPELDGVELDNQDDFGTLAQPPPSRQRAPVVEEARGSIKRSTAPPPTGKKANLPKPKQGNGPAAAFVPKAQPKPVNAAQSKKKEATSVELDDDELIEVSGTFEPEATPFNKPGPKSQVRSSVGIAAGPLPDTPLPSFPRPSAAATRPTAQAQPAVGPQQLASLLAGQPHVMQPQQRMPMAPATMPTAAAMQYPARALDISGQPVVDALFGGQVAPAPAWAKSTVAAQPMSGYPAPPTQNGMPLPTDAVQSLLEGMEQASNLMIVEPTNSSASRPMKTGIRKGRSRFQIVMWIFIGGLVIGGGVFAGFQIRSMRLAKQIDAARSNAVDNAKADTWRGWLAARDSLGGIAQASATLENRAALARARGLLAFEFGEGVPEAKIAVDNLGGKGELDAAIGAAYVALARNEAKVAKLAIERATKLAPDDAATLYVSGQLALLTGETKTARKQLQAAVEKEGRALYYVGLARAGAAVGEWDDALAAIDKALAASAEHPGALIERAKILVASGRVAPKQGGADVRRQLEKIVTESAKPIGEQPRGVSPLQISFAHLALAQLAFAMADADALATNIKAALKVNVDDPRFAELASETVMMTGTMSDGTLFAEKAALTALAGSPTSRRAMVVLAESMLAQGRANDALDFLNNKGTDATALPRGRALLGHIKLAVDDLAGAKADFDAAATSAPKLELVVIGLAMIELATGNATGARDRLEKIYKPAGATVALTIAYASALRSTRDPTARDKAKAMLEKILPATIGLEVASLHLEIARVNRDLGLRVEAKKAFAEAAKIGNAEIRLEAALHLIEEQDAAGGRAAIDAILKTIADANQKPSGRLLVESARAAMLLGDHLAAEGFLAQAEKAQATPWRLERERARLKFRRGDITGASETILIALETSDTDVETLLIAADIRYVDLATENKEAVLGAKLEGAVAARIKGTPEAAIIAGKLALAVGKNDEAEGHYKVAIVAFEKVQAVARRTAQASFGLAVVEYNRDNVPTAKDKLELVLVEDPTLYDAYLFRADLMLRTKDAKGALELAKKAAVYNSESVQAWHMIGRAAAALSNSKALGDAITQLTKLAPASEELKELTDLRR